MVRFVTKPRLVVATLLLLIALSCAVRSAWAVSARQTLAQLHHTAWTTREGAPSDIVALAQTPNGLLWLGTGTGLFNFDGATFERFQAGAGKPSLREGISALYVDANGDLWIGTLFGKVHVLHLGTLRSFDASSGLPDHSIRSFARDLTGRMWIGTTTGIYSLEGNIWRLHPIKTATPHEQFLDVAVDRNGTVWAGSTAGAFSLRHGDRSFAPGPLYESPRVRIDTEGLAWGAGYGRTVGLTAGDHFLLTPKTRSTEAKDSFIRLFDREGTAWFASSTAGLSRAPISALIATTRTRPREVTGSYFKLGLSGTEVQTAFEDREGSVWLGTNGGLDRFRGNKFTSVGDGTLQFSNAALAPATGGNVWAGTDGSGLSVLGSSVIRPRVFTTKTYETFSALHRAADGTIWAGSYGELWHSAKNGYVRVPLPFDKTPSFIQAIATDIHANVWISKVNSGVWLLHDGKWSHNGGLAGMPDGPSLCISALDSGDVWLGYPDGKVALIKDGRAITFGNEDGPLIGNVLSIFKNKSQVWFGGTDGVAYYQNGRFHRLNTSQPDSLTGVSGIVASVDGDLWFNGADAITRVTASDVESLNADPSRMLSSEVMNSIDGRDGIAPQLSPLQTAVRSEDGRLWFATTQNVYWIDPSKIYRNPVAPSVFIRSLNEGDMHLRPIAGIVVPEEITAIDIEYTATSLAAPERVRFRYRLEGVDQTWQDAGNRRRIWYTNLKPGSYRFSVTAANEDGVWNATGAILSFKIATPFDQTLWFFLLCAFSGIVCLVGIGFLRVRQVSDRIRLRLNAQSSERERIARELHDTMLQGTQGLVLNMQVIAADLPTDDVTRLRIEHSLDQADEVIAQVRDNVKRLREFEPDGHAIIQRLHELVQELKSIYRVKVDVETDTAVRKLSADVCQEAYKIAREALLNACRHAEAKSIKVRLRFNRSNLALLVSDDGVGMDELTISEGSRPGHWGLPGMRERAASIDGQLNITSGSGFGTQVSLIVPAARAYLPVARGAFLRRFAGNFIRRRSRQ